MPVRRQSCRLPWAAKRGALAPRSDPRPALDHLDALPQWLWFGDDPDPHTNPPRPESRPVPPN